MISFGVKTYEVSYEGKKKVVDPKAFSILLKFIAVIKKQFKVLKRNSLQFNITIYHYNK
jgi:hypothetical protein